MIAYIIPFCSLCMCLASCLHTFVLCIYGMLIVVKCRAGVVTFKQCCSEYLELSNRQTLP